LAVIGLLGCSAHVDAPKATNSQARVEPVVVAAAPAPAAAAPATQTADVATNVAKLRALQIFEVGDVIVHAPQSGNCYGFPCSADVAAAKAKAAERLDAFTNKAVTAAALPPAQGVTSVQANAMLDELRALDVVTIGDLLVASPKNNPNCYNVPCPEDREAAAATNAVRAGKLANIVKASP
jgi:hypothetical protein